MCIILFLSDKSKDVNNIKSAPSASSKSHLGEKENGEKREELT